MRCFREFLKKLELCDPSFDIHIVEIVFLVPHQRIPIFKLEPVSGQDLLVEYGWDEDEVIHNVRILSMERWDGTF